MLKSDLHSTLPLYAPSSVQSHCWTLVLQLPVDSMLVVEVVVEVAVELCV